jgi:hypothetical protein
MLVEIAGLLGEERNVARGYPRPLDASPRCLPRQQVQDALGVPAAREREPKRAVRSHDTSGLIESCDQLADWNVARRSRHASLSPKAGKLAHDSECV